MVKDQHPGRTVALLVLANIIFSSGVPLGAGIINKPLDGAENLLVGTMLFCAGSLLEILYYLALLKERAIKEDIVWDSHELIDSKLSSIRKALRSLESGVDPRNDIFLKYFQGRVFSLESEVRQTAGNKELRVDSQNLDLSGPLLDSFTGKETDVLRIVHFFAQNDALFNVHEAQWFYRVYEAADTRRLVEVRRLLIYADQAELEDMKSKRLMGFLTGANNYDYRILAQRNFDRLCGSFRLQGEFADFGIYGERYLFRGILYADTDFVGSYSRDLETITRYVNFFDFCWNSPTSRTLNAAALPTVSLAELFDPDD